jgi:membrane-bound ClpP family serine protease
MKILVAIILAVVAFEIIEHVLLPLVWVIVARKKRSVTGPEGLLGKTVEVKHWADEEGRVLVRGELWKAVSKDPLTEGDKAVVEKVDGLTLIVKRLPQR